jgi:hypothetical protein
MKSHHKVDIKLNTEPLREYLNEHQDLFGVYNYRGGFSNSPHREMTDIWVRYNDITPYLETEDFSTFAEEHDSVWYPISDKLPIKPLLFELMTKVQGERLGGVLITQLPPHCEIHPHVDGGWHAGYYDKYYVPIQTSKGDVFGFEDGNIKPTQGDAWWFDNSVRHWVQNNTNYQRLSLIVCIKTNNKLGE